MQKDNGGGETYMKLKQIATERCADIFSFLQGADVDVSKPRNNDWETRRDLRQRRRGTTGVHREQGHRDGGQVRREGVKRYSGHRHGSQVDGRSLHTRGAQLERDDDHPATH